MNKVLKEKNVLKERKRGLEITEPSLTVPDDHYTIDEILHKFTRGLDLPLVRNTQYDEDPDFDSAQPMDLDLIDIDRLQKDLADMQKTLLKAKAQQKESLEKDSENRKEAERSEPSEDL